LNRPIQEIGKLTEFSSNLGDQFGLKIDIITQVNEIQALAYSLNKLSQKLYSNKTIMLEQQEKLQQFNDELWKQVEEETRKNREKDAILVQQSRLAALGEMIGNIAHQWRQPLNAIAIEIQDLDLSYQLGELSDKEVSISTQEIMKHVLYLSQTIDDFRDLVQANKCYEPFLVSEVIFKILELMSSTFKASSIKLVLHIDESIIANHGSSQGLSQAIINILSNAKDILVQNNSENEREITLRLSQVLNDNFSKTVLSIEDNGGGIESDIVSKIFDPYFTTKHQSQGTGLGLYISKNIIEQELLGTLQVVATKHGTLFSIEWDS
jgi:C4-dicarboxylate-specific signal transduction histidine kinase